MPSSVVRKKQCALDYAGWLEGGNPSLCQHDQGCTFHWSEYHVILHTRLWTTHIIAWLLAFTIKNDSILLSALY